jgi:alkylation response protein AidB-like acyl-CoA dehydrogenase
MPATEPKAACGSACAWSLAPAGSRYRSDSAAAPARSRCTSYAAAQAAEHGAPDTGLRAAAAKVYCFEALQQVSAEMIQLRGAIGMTWEHMAHRYFKRGHGAAMLVGPPAGHVARIAATVVDR